MVVIDASILMLFLRPDIPVRAAPGGASIKFVKERIQHLIEQIEKARTKIIIPTPVLSEVLVRAGAAASQKIVEEVNRLAVFRIEPFDARAAIEVAAMTRAALDAGNKRGAAAADAIWAKVKYDRQIVAIAKVSRATTIYTDDGDLGALARAEGIAVVGLADLPIPEGSAQKDLFKHQEVDDEEPPKKGNDD